MNTPTQREHFEQIEAVKRHTIDGYIYFDGEKYVLKNQELLKTQCGRIHDLNVAWVNGAWFMFQDKNILQDALV